jgi:hypothetical protein
VSKQAGLHVRETRVAKSSGATVQCIDALHPDDVDFRGDAEDSGRWVSFCYTHGSFVHHQTWRTCRAFLGAPEEWCEGCAAVVENGEGPEQTDDPFTAEERERARQARAAKAAERAAEREHVAAEKTRRRSLEEQWAAFVRAKPLELENVWLPEERLIVSGLKHAQFRAQAKLSAYRSERRLADAALPKAATKEAARLEKRIAELEDLILAEEGVVGACRRERDRMANRTWLRGALEAGLRYEENGVGPVLRGRGEEVRLPDDFLPRQDLKELAG